MPFRRGSQLDPSQVTDRRGRRGAGLAIGGGGLGIIVLLVSLLTGVDLTGLTGGTGIDTGPSLPLDGGQVDQQSSLAENCRTGEDANQSQDCRIVGFVNSIQAFWDEEFARNGAQYQPAQTELFTGATQSACGSASAAMGPFYCPRDQKVYVDLSFFQELEGRFGARGGPFAEAYVLAHEYGHHIQNLTGNLSNTSQATGPQSEAVQTELMADCLAGVWANNAAETGFLEPVTEQEIAQALDAAAAVGDDRIQAQTQGYVSPESWTHGSSRQRQQALLNGYRTGDINACQ